MKVIELREDNQIQVARKEFKEKKYIDVRIYFKAKEDNTMIPSKKGITFKDEHLQPLIDALTALKNDQS